MKYRVLFGKITFGILTLLSLLPVSFEVVSGFSFLTLTTILLFNPKFSKTFLQLLAPILFILILAILRGFSKAIFDWNAIKDFFYLAKPVVFILLGYLLARNIGETSKFYILIVKLAVVFAVIHIIRCGYYIFSVEDFSINSLRSNVGRDNVIELFGIIILIANFKFKKFELGNTKYIFILLMISFVMYFSRTMFVLFVVLSLASIGYLRLSKKSIIYVSVLTIGALSFYIYLANSDISRSSDSPIEKFLYKIKIAPAEIFEVASEIDVSNRAELWDHWRAYEAKTAIQEVYSDGPSSWFFGTGMGSLIDLKVNAPLSDDPKGMRYISLIHNGYVFILYKAGVIGLVLLSIFFLSNHHIVKKVQSKSPFKSNLLYALNLFYLFTTLVITGIYNISDPVSLIYGGVIYLIVQKKEDKIEKIESRNNWNKRNSK